MRRVTLPRREGGRRVIELPGQTPRDVLAAAVLMTTALREGRIAIEDLLPDETPVGKEAILDMVVLATGRGGVA
ncbi:MAG: hypothetical protein ACUVT2_11405 [Thiobacillaceae bacterium]